MISPTTHPELLVAAHELVVPSRTETDPSQSNTFVNKTAVDLGAVSLELLADMFDAAYPDGMPDGKYRVSIANSAYDPRGTQIEAADQGYWSTRRIRAATEILSAAETLLQPLFGDFAVHYSRVIVTDEVTAASKRLADRNELPHLDNPVIKSGAVIALATFPRTTLYLRGGWQTACEDITSTFFEGNVTLDAARIQADDWETTEGHAHLFSAGGTIHKKPERPADAPVDERFRVMWRAELSRK